MSVNTNVEMMIWPAFINGKLAIQKSCVGIFYQDSTFEAISFYKPSVPLDDESQFANKNQSCVLPEIGQPGFANTI